MTMIEESLLRLRRRLSRPADASMSWLRLRSCKAFTQGTEVRSVTAEADDQKSPRKSPPPPPMLLAVLVVITSTKTHHHRCHVIQHLSSYCL